MKRMKYIGLLATCCILGVSAAAAETGNSETSVNMTAAETGKTETSVDMAAAETENSETATDSAAAGQVAQAGEMAAIEDVVSKRFRFGDVCNDFVQKTLVVDIPARGMEAFLGSQFGGEEEIIHLHNVSIQDSLQAFCECGLAGSCSAVDGDHADRTACRVPCDCLENRQQVFCPTRILLAQLHDILRLHRRVELDPLHRTVLKIHGKNPFALCGSSIIGICPIHILVYWTGFIFYCIC